MKKIITISFCLIMLLSLTVPISAMDIGKVPPIEGISGLCLSDIVRELEQRLPGISSKPLNSNNTGDIINDILEDSFQMDTEPETTHPFLLGSTTSSLNDATIIIIEIGIFVIGTGIGTVIGYNIKKKKKKSEN